VGAFSDLFARLDPDPRVRGKQFEHVCKWFLTNDPVYKHELRRVWLWDEWTGRWGGDAGIDLVAEDRTGNLWAIQAKAYDPTYRVTKRDVNKFLAESGRAMFTYRMLIATTNLIDRIGERTVQDQEKKVTFFRLKNLQTADVDWPASPTALRPMRPRKPARPHDYQREAIRKVIKGFASTERGQLIMACGTGKTLTALFIREKLAAERTLVLVPSLSLLKQTLNVWRANCTAEFVSLPVCSDDTVARGDDVALEHTSDIGVPVTTDPSEIAAFLRRRSGPQVVFATYQSSPQIAKAFTSGRVPGFDLIVADEAHRCAGPVSSDFATVLDTTKMKAKQRLFMTATPRYFTGRVLRAAEDAEFEYASMDDEAKFGRVFHHLGFGEAIERDLLTDYQVAIVGVDDATYLQWAKTGVLVSRDGVKITDAASLAGQIGLAKAMRKYDLERVISFHSRVKRAREFAASMPDVLAWMPGRQRPKGELWSRYASGEMPAGDRYVLLQQLGRLDNADRGLLANARCLAEGVDVPTLDGVAFIDPRRSEVDIVQAVGRAIRKSEDKTVGTIVIPVFIDTDANPELALVSSAFKPVWDVIRALRSHDDELGRQLDELRRELGRRRAKPRLPDKIHIDIPRKVDAAFAEAFDVRLVEQTTASWEFWFGLLRRCVDEVGSAAVPSDCVVDGHKLGKWINVQRTQYSRGVLDLERQRRLEELPGWTWNTLKAAWERGFEYLVEFVRRNGHAGVAFNGDLNGFPLGQWVALQRANFATGKLGDERRARLETLAGWTWNLRQTKWEKGFQRLVEYVAQHGSASVPKEYVVDGYRLGSWITSQRGKRDTLTPDRRERLEALPGWSWHTLDTRWEEGFRQLQGYVDRHGDALVPASYRSGDFRLGGWVNEQRTRYARDLIDRQRQERLEALPKWVWNKRDAVWEEGFTRLTSYAEIHGTAHVPVSTKPDGFPLGKWVIAQRARRASGTLSVERQERLEQLPGWTWNRLDSQWEAGYQQLLEYVDSHGEAAVPFSYKVNGFNLGGWANKQRDSYRSGKLTSERTERLQRLPGWLWDPLGDAWEEAFCRLLRNVETHGTAQVSQSHEVDGFNLSAWCMKQRSKYRDGTLGPDRQERLEALPGWSWDPYTERWETVFGLMLEYVAANGDARVPTNHEVGGIKLDGWVREQRTRYSQGRLESERQERLEALAGWSWNPHADKWEEGFRHLVEFTKQRGNARVPTSYVSDGYSLGMWAVTQRSNYRQGVLARERQERLESLPGWEWTYK